MKIYDVTMTIEETMPVYKNKEEKKPLITVNRDFETSDTMESRICMDMHTGTHMDMPLHFLRSGKSVETLELNRVIATCKVVDLTHIEGGISKKDLVEKDLFSVSFVLLKTKNSYEETFRSDFIYLKADGAEYLQTLKLDGVGIDGLGIERNQPDHQTHKTLLGSGIIILEGLRLAHVEEGIYTIIALPMKIKGVEASPTRVVLIDEETKYNTGTEAT